MLAQKIVPVRIRMHEIEDPALLEGFDPKEIVGMISKDQKTLTVTVLDHGIPLREKALVEIPQVNFKAGHQPTIVKSIQLKNISGGTFVLAEVSGPLNSVIYFWIQACALKMQALNLVNAFFPAYKSPESTLCIQSALSQNGKFEKWDKTLTNVEGINNVRLLKGDAVVFSVCHELLTAPFAGIASNKIWNETAKVLHSYENTIAFIGRAKDGSIPVTLTDGRVFYSEINYTMPTSNVGNNLKSVESTALHGACSFIGPIGSGIMAAIMGDKFMIMPTASAAA